MKFLSRLLLLLLATGLQAQSNEATLNYIHVAWPTLTRSVSDCAAYADAKVTTQPVLYLPAEVPTTAELNVLAARCHIRLGALPHIEQLGDVRPESLQVPGLLYLPHPYVVPGGRFNEMYGWDSFFIILGLEDDHQAALAKGMVDNFLFEVEHYGAVLNANRSYYLTRSQPPLLTSMIRAVLENPESFPATAKGRKERQEWLAHAYQMAVKDRSTWERSEHHNSVTGLARYWDYGSGPVPEMADDSSYYPDVIRWLVEHPAQAEGMLLKASEHLDTEEAARLVTTSCDVHASMVCLRAWADGFRLTHDFYQGDRAMRESGYDPSFRFGAFSGATHHYAPVCLNSLLYRYERDLEHFAQMLGKGAEAERWQQQAKDRMIDMNHYQWQPKQGGFADYDAEHGRASKYAFITSFYTLWAGVATREQAKEMVEHLKLFERVGGISMSNTRSGLQWDEPFGWAPANWFVVKGLEAFGYHAEAQRIARAFNHTVDVGFARDGTIREKYNVVDVASEVTVSTGYKANGIGFGWTNGTYLEFDAILKRR
jgi:alpha,alpha-trehalase